MLSHELEKYVLDCDNRVLVSDSLAERVSASLTAGTAMLALALVIVVVLIVRPGRLQTPLSTARA